MDYWHGPAEVEMDLAHALSVLEQKFNPIYPGFLLSHERDIYALQYTSASASVALR